MTIHLASWLVWMLAASGYMLVGVLCCKFLTVVTMDVESPLIYLVRLAALVAWPVMLALLFAWCVVIVFARMVFE